MADEVVLVSSLLVMLFVSALSALTGGRWITEREGSSVRRLSFVADDVVFANPGGMSGLDPKQFERRPARDDEERAVSDQIVWGEGEHSRWKSEGGGRPGGCARGQVAQGRGGLTTENGG